MVFNFFLFLLLLFLFFFSSKLEKWSISFSSGFECGFSSYLMSWNSFSIQYLIIAIIFLFLDLELVFIFVFFFNFFSLVNFFFFFFFFVFFLLMGIFLEWYDGMFDWVF